MSTDDGVLVAKARDVPVIVDVTPVNTSGGTKRGDETSAQAGRIDYDASATRAIDFRSVDSLAGAGQGGQACVGGFARL
ncbi:hypothetical protein KCU90_g125, partial [Aureobasidium melanogenum]